MIFKQVLCALQAAALMLTVPAASTERSVLAVESEVLSESDPFVFADTIGHPAEDAIHTFASLGILLGDGQGNFNPNGKISRAAMCVLLDRLFSYTEQVENRFYDVAEDVWYTEAVLKLLAAGVIQGDGAGYFDPTGAITVEGTITMLARAFGIEERFDVELPYEDADSVSSWAVGHVAAFYAAGYLTDDALLTPKRSFTRAETAALLARMIDDLGWESVGKLLVGGELIEWFDYQYHPDLFEEENGRVYYIGDDVTPLYGIDVSNHQGDIDWTAVAEDGVDFVMIRLGYRGYTAGLLNLDLRFLQNIEGALEAGLQVGVYFFSQAITVEEALEEAQLVLETLEPYRDRITFPVAYDWENIGKTSARTYGLSTETLNACALAFCAAVEEAGYDSLIYFYPNLGRKFYDLDTISVYPFWYCYYNNIYPNLERPFQMWQYSSTGRVNGIQGNVDLDICFWTE